MLGRWLFGGGTSAEAAPGAGGGSGFGMMDLILLGGIGLLIYLFIAKRRREQAAAALPGVHQSSMADSSIQPPYYELEAAAGLGARTGPGKRPQEHRATGPPVRRRPVQGPGHGFFL
jgi:hypothetical protein